MRSDADRNAGDRVDRHQAHTPRRFLTRRLVLLASLVVIAGLVCAVIALRGLSAPQEDVASVPEINPTPADGDESQDQWARMKEDVLRRYPDAEFVQVGSSAQRTRFHLTPPRTSGTTGLLVAISCRGGDQWFFRVDQRHPVSVGGQCGAVSTAGPIALDAHRFGVFYEVTPPRGTRFWSVVFYTHDS